MENINLFNVEEFYSLVDDATKLSCDKIIELHKVG